MRCRVLKQKRKKEKVATNSEEHIKAGKPLGKFGRGELAHEFWEEERRLREKKRKERLAKEEKKRGAGCPREEEELPSSGSTGTGPNKVINLSSVNSMIDLIDDLLSDIIFKQTNKGEEKEKDVGSSEEEERLSSSGSPGAGPDLSSNKVTNISQVNPEIETIINTILGDVISKQAEESFLLMTDGSSSEGEQEDIGASEDGPVSTCSGSPGTGVYFKDLGVNKVTHIYNEAKNEIPCLTSDSESDAGEEERMSAVPSSDGKSDKEEEGKRVRVNVKDVPSSKCHLQSALKSDLKLMAEDSDNQYGDDESEEEEEKEKEKKKKQRRKSLPRGRGGAGQWEELAERERLRMVAIMRKKMVAIAVQVHSHCIYIWSDHYCSGCCS